MHKEVQCYQYCKVSHIFFIVPKKLDERKDIGTLISFVTFGKRRETFKYFGASMLNLLLGNMNPIDVKILWMESYSSLAFCLASLFLKNWVEFI